VFIADDASLDQYAEQLTKEMKKLPKGKNTPAQTIERKGLIKKKIPAVKKCAIQFSLNVIAGVALVITVIFVVGGLLNAKTLSYNGINNCIITVIAGAIFAVFFFALAKIIGLLLQIEQNTRKS
jgi:uncharacterized membrane protein